MILRRHVIFAAFIGLLLLSLWLGVVTHFALSSMEQRRKPSAVQDQQTDDSLGRGEREEAGQPNSNIGGQPPTRSTINSALEEMQSTLLKRRIKELESEAERNEQTLKALREELEACEKRRLQPVLATEEPTPPPTQAPYVGNLDLYQQEQLRIKDQMRKQRQEVLGSRYRQQPGGFANSVSDRNTPPYLGNSVGLSLSHFKSLHRRPEEEDMAEVIAVVVIAYQRAQQLELCVDNLLRRMPHRGFRLYASQDGEDFPEVTALLRRYETNGKLTRMVHQRNTSGGTEEEYQNGWESYLAISHHVQFVFTQLFQGSFFNRVILIEEDIEVGVDFFDYMSAMSPLLDRDPTLYCVSAWNDNGKADRIADPKAVYRTDFFPGLGWMIHRRLWEELAPKWPAGFWDDWLRQPKNRKGRSCLRPEVPRSFTWCTDEGVSQGQFCAEHLASIKLADTSVNWARVDTSYLLKNSYDEWIDGLLKRAKKVVTADEIFLLPVANGGRRGPNGDGGEITEVQLTYHNNDDFQVMAMSLNLMEDFKDNVPRTAYRGIVTFRHLHYRVHLVPETPLYD
jgi:alpha-1,3-mannosyl-glycoprotein beta-1,2-N-acetylglucosaminyltransferase